MDGEATPATDFIRSLVSAWDCCGTCAGGVLARHDREVAATALNAAADSFTKHHDWAYPYLVECQRWLRSRAANTP